MRLLVTGGAGFIGSHLVRFLLNEHSSYEVVVLDALTYAGSLGNVADIADSPRFTFVKGNITNFDLVSTLVENADAIIHTAAETHVDRSIESSRVFIETNVLGTQTLLEAARKYKTRFHHVSTDEVFGSLGPHDPAFSETTPYSPRSPYAASKAASDHLVRAYAHTYGIPVTISNCSNNYGSHMYPEKMIPLFVKKLLQGEKVPVYGNGEQIRDWLHVEDHVRGIDEILHEGRFGETYCLGGNNERTNLEVVHLLLQLTNRDSSAIEFVSDRPGHDTRYAINFTKAHEEFGFEPRIPFEAGLRRTVEWYKNHPEALERGSV